MTIERIGHWLGLYRRSADARAILALLVANAIPIVGVLFLGWSLATILVLFWLENGIVGAWNVPRMLLAGGSFMPPADAPSPPVAGAPSTASIGRILGTRPAPVAARIGMVAFFLVHYGMFWVVHGIFVFLLPSFLGSADPACGGAVSPGAGRGDIDCAAAGSFGEVVWSNVAIAGLALFFSHGASFLFNYLGRGEYRTASVGSQMQAPYARVVILHVTIIFGAMLVALLGAPIAALLVLLGLKTAVDLRMHLRERERSTAAAI